MSDVFDALRDTFDALVFDPLPSYYMFVHGGMHFSPGLRSIKWRQWTRAHSNKYHRHKKRPNGRGRGR